MAWNKESYPKTFNMGAHTIKVKVLPEPLREDKGLITIGAYYSRAKEIACTHDNTSPSTYGENFVHEVMEAANDINDLQLSHQTITTMAAALFQAFSSGKVNFGD